MARKKKRRSSKNTKRAFRVDSWFNGVSGKRGLQMEKPCWVMRGTFAERKLATKHRKQLESAEHCTTRVVGVSA